MERAYELAYCLDRLREHERAQGQYALAASLDTGNGNTLYKLGLASERVGDLATAERSYQEALRTLKKPARSWWNYRRGVCLARLGRHDEALASFWAYLGPARAGWHRCPSRWPARASSTWSREEHTSASAAAGGPGRVHHRRCHARPSRGSQLPQLYG